MRVVRRSLRKQTTRRCRFVFVVALAAYILNCDVPLYFVTLLGFAALWIPMIWGFREKARPPAWIVFSSRVATIVAAILWVVLSIFELQWRPQQFEQWTIGGGRISYMTGYIPGNTPVGPATIRLVNPLPGWLTISEMSRGDLFIGGRRMASYEWHGPIHGLLLCTIVPAWMLAALRRTRPPRGHCPECGYDLRGNVSGRCPECGTPVNQPARHLA